MKTTTRDKVSNHAPFLCMKVAPIFDSLRSVWADISPSLITLELLLYIRTSWALITHQTLILLIVLKPKMEYSSLQRQVAYMKKGLFDQVCGLLLPSSNRAYHA